MTSCASAADLLGQCHPRCWLQLAQGQVPRAGQHRMGRAGAGPQDACSQQLLVPKHSHVAPGWHWDQHTGSCWSPGLPALPLATWAGGWQGGHARSPSWGAADQGGCCPASRAVGAAVQSVTSTPALLPAAGGLFLLRNVPSPQILAGCRACVTGRRLSPGPVGGKYSTTAWGRSMGQWPLPPPGAAQRALCPSCLPAPGCWLLPWHSGSGKGLDAHTLACFPPLPSDAAPQPQQGVLGAGLAGQ